MTLWLANTFERVPVNKELFTETVLGNKKLFTGTVPISNLFLKGMNQINLCQLFDFETILI